MVLHKVVLFSLTLDTSMLYRYLGRGVLRKVVLFADLQIKCKWKRDHNFSFFSPENRNRYFMTYTSHSKRDKATFQHVKWNNIPASGNIVMRGCHTKNMSAQVMIKLKKSWLNMQVSTVFDVIYRKVLLWPICQFSEIALFNIVMFLLSHKI